MFKVLKMTCQIVGNVTGIAILGAAVSAIDRRNGPSCISKFGRRLSKQLFFGLMTSVLSTLEGVTGHNSFYITADNNIKTYKKHRMFPFL